MRFTISSDFAAAREVQKALLAKLAELDYHPHAVFAIKLALEEALVNAIKHGNRCDASKKVRVQATITPKQMSLSVEDQGKGFKRADVPDPTAEENLEKCTGRGLLLMETYMDSVRYSKGGRCISMTRKNRPDTLPRVQPPRRTKRCCRKSC